MGKNKFIVLIVFLFFVFAVVQKIYAASVASGSSAQLEPIPPIKVGDSRVIVLREFLTKYHSPLANLASIFVENADKYNLDWRLVAAISGLESTFGQQIPYNSYNGWGWGIYGDNIIRFSTWEEGIQTVSQGLREKYIDKLETDDVYAIGRWYAASPTWADRVSFIMEKITQFQLGNPNSLSISI